MEEYTVLSIDDDESARTLFQIMFERAGFNVVQAIDADEALQIIEELTPSVIMTDIQLPGMNGIELTALLRERAELDCTPIIVLSAFQSKDMVEQCLAAGADEFWRKPLTLTGLGDRLKALIRQKCLDQ